MWATVPNVPQQNARPGHTEAAALRPGGAGDGGEAGGGVQAGRLPAPPLAGLLDHVDGVRLEGEAHVDLDDAPGAEEEDRKHRVRSPWSLREVFPALPGSPT